MRKLAWGLLLISLSGCATSMQDRRMREPGDAGHQTTFDWANFKPFQPIPNFITPAQATPSGAAGIATSSVGANAYWTGRQNQVQTVTYQFGWSCEYNYAGRMFWRTFVGTCPQLVQVQ